MLGAEELDNAHGLLARVLRLLKQIQGLLDFLVVAHWGELDRLLPGNARLHLMKVGVSEPQCAGRLEDLLVEVVRLFHH